LAVAFGVDRATITRAIGQIRPLLAGCGFATATGVRLKGGSDRKPVCQEFTPKR